MNLFDDLNEKNYVHYAMKYYMNNQCTSVEEFNEDLNKVKYVKRLFNRFLDTGELRINLIMNHLIVIYNVFETEAATRMLFFRVEKKFYSICLLYTSDAADDTPCVDLGGRRIII